MAYGASFKNDGRLKLLIVVGTRPEIIRLSEVIRREGPRDRHVGQRGLRPREPRHLLRGGLAVAYGASFKNDGRLKLLIVVGTRPEIIRLSEVIKKCRRHFDCLLAHTGQNWDYTLNGIFFRDLGLADPDAYLDAVGDDLGSTIGNIIDKSYKLMAEVRPDALLVLGDTNSCLPDALLVLGDTNSCLSAIPAKRLHVPVFHMEAGNRCRDERLPEETNRRIVDVISDVNMAYSEHARRWLAATGCAPERTFVTGSPMAEVLRANLAQIDASDILEREGLEPEPPHSGRHLRREHGLLRARQALARRDRLRA